MNIGILAYHSACNYGANLQVLSTVGYLKRNGHNPIVINYETKSDSPTSFHNPSQYAKIIPKEAKDE